MPAKIHFIPEWAELDLVLLTWPNDDMDWAYMLPEVERCYTDIARTLLDWVDVLILARDPERVRELVTPEGRPHQLFLMEAENNDTWCRDYAPLSLYVEDEEGKRHPRILDFTFNGWGMKFAANKDNLISRALYLARVFRPEVGYSNALSVTFEGGGIETDGEGTLMTTESVLYEPNRNSGLDEAVLRDYLMSLLGGERLIALENGELEGDDTDGHIDTLARFLSPTQIAYVGCSDGHDSHYHALRRMREELEALRTPAGQPYELVELPLPPAIYDEEGQRLPATYANFLFAGKALLVPTYGEATDEPTLEALRRALPEHTIVGVNCRALIYQHGSLHCATMQFPKGFINKNKWSEN